MGLLVKKYMGMGGEIGPAEDGRMWVYYNIASTASTTILYATTGLSRMEIDGVDRAVAKTFSFGTTGEHLVKFTISGSLGQNFRGNSIPVRKIYLPSSITSCPDAFCHSNTSVQLLSIPGCTNFVSNCCSYCFALKEVVYSPNLLRIGANCFIACDNLVGHNLPDTVTTITGDSVIRRCGKWTFDKLPDSLAGALGNATFYETPLTITELPAGVTSLAPNTFLSQKRIPYLHILNTSSVVTINANSFGSTSFKIYVGTGESEEADNALLDLYLDNSVWSANYASRLDTWYNYLHN